MLITASMIPVTIIWRNKTESTKDKNKCRVSSEPGKKQTASRTLSLRRRVRGWCVFRLLFLFLLLVFGSLGAETARTGITLVDPVNHYRLMTPAVTFLWNLERDSLLFRPQYYEVLFWSKHQSFSLIRTVYPDASLNASMRLTDIPEIFRKHGRYYWQVQAVMEDGRRIKSDVRELIMPIPRSMQSMLPAWFPFAVQWKNTHRIKDAGFERLMDQVYPKSHLDDHSDISLIFRQPFIAHLNLDLEERLLFHSSIGLGGEFSARWRMIENSFFALRPGGSAGVCWYGTGLGRYSSMRSQTDLGVDLVINPNGYVSSFARWIPMHRFHYSVADDGFRVFKGDGFEWGVHLVVPRHIVNPFRILNVEIDMERLPIEYTYSHIQDDYTGVRMKTQEIGVSFLFQ